MEKVLVTGATGYIGLHCIQQLLNQGYRVNGSVRSPERMQEVFEALKENNTSTENLNLFILKELVLKMDKAERQKMQEKLNRQYIDFKLNPVIEPMVISYVQNIETNP